MIIICISDPTGNYHPCFFLSKLFCTLTGLGREFLLSMNNNSKKAGVSNQIREKQKLALLKVIKMIMMLLDVSYLLHNKQEHRKTILWAFESLKYPTISKHKIVIHAKKWEKELNGEEKVVHSDILPRHFTWCRWI